MAEANSAYQHGDEERLRAILRDWDSSPEALKGDDIATQLVRAIRRIAQLRNRLHAIAHELARLEQSELYQLRAKVADARAAGQNLLAEMAQRIDAQIDERRERLRRMRLRDDVR
jgi:hypothetical protein